MNSGTVVVVEDWRVDMLAGVRERGELTLKEEEDRNDELEHNEDSRDRRRSEEDEKGEAMRDS